MERSKEAFIRKYVEELRGRNAALFIGAGFSKPAGCVDWRELLNDMAEELGLDINKENDLVELAQYHYNKKGNRSYVTQLIKNKFSNVEINETNNENHKIISRLPIFAYWTTNYDNLIEKNLESNHRIPDIKKTDDNLSITEPYRDCIVYKMHGDSSSPNEAIILKDDYETYYKKHTAFVNALKGDLISRTFLFLGFSFTDPNINYILSRIRVDYNKDNMRQHYAIMREVKREDYSSDEEFEYFKNKFSLFREDLKRYCIEVLLIEDYSEVTEILKEIERRLNLKTVFISGSAHSYYPYQDKEAQNFITELSKKLIQKGYNIISGFGLGIGSEVIIGALKEIYMNEKKINSDRLLLRPFPQGIQDETTRTKLWSQYRKDMISQAGVSLFLFGNKLDPVNEGKVINANGVREEYRISKELKNILIPVASTGYVAKEIYEEVLKEDLECYGNKKEKVKSLFDKLNTNSLDEELIDNIIKILNIVNK